ncbi:hypothetical protein [Burkholderia ubonensis]|uniref:hypothetical protein n=1 Tax=Burkholderia ubonensis TaxID=101571 RepID=UPI002AB19A7E|nr:hypothetical protein [Burkholderia ubonensis]
MNSREAVSAAVQAAPPVGVLGASYFGHTLNEWLVMGSAALLVCQFIVIAPKVYRTLTGKESK